MADCVFAFFFFLKWGDVVLSTIFSGWDRIVWKAERDESSGGGQAAVVRAFANANEVQEMSQIFASWDSVTLSESQGGSRFFLFWFQDFLREKDDIAVSYATVRW